MKRLWIVLFILMFSVFAVSAEGVDDQGNPNDPETNDRANACYEGGSMEGKCDTDWEWECGWHLIQFEYGLTERDEFPAWCISIIPPEIVPDELEGVVNNTPCKDIGIGWVVFPSSNYLPTGMYLLFSNNTCTTLSIDSPSVFTQPHVVANSVSSATALCVANGHTFDFGPIGDVYFCNND